MGRGLPAIPPTRPSPVKRQPGRRGARKKRTYYRPHKVHYYLVLTGISLAIGVCVLNTVGYATHRVDLADVAFWAIAAAALVICSAFFMGFFMIMNGNIPSKRIRILAPHAVVGTLSPLFYTLNIAAALDGLGTRPVTLLSLVVSYLCLVLLAVQFAMGKAVVRPEPLRLLKPADLQ